MDKAIVVVGPTASGKTSLGVHIAKKFNGEVISADSMQIYKGMNISTAKPTVEEMCGIKHYLVDFLDATETYSVSNFCKDAKIAFDEIKSKGKIPVIVGGTGLYIDSFLTNTEFIESAKNDKIKDELNAELDLKGPSYMYQKLKEVDPEAAKNIHPNNKIRVLRALEVFYSTGITISQQVKLSHKVQSNIQPLYIGISYYDREKLYKRINDRVDLMLKNGLVEEAEKFFSEDYSETSFNSIGCKEIKPFLNGEKSLDECIENLKKSTRHYAKRQLTWFKRNENINWFYPDLFENKNFYDNIDSLIFEFLGDEQGA